MAVGFMLFSLWKAKLISYLAQRSIVLPFDGVESLMLNSDYKIFAWPSSAQTDSFKLSKVPIWQQAWLERMEPNQEFYKEYIEGTCSVAKQFSIQSSNSLLQMTMTSNKNSWLNILTMQCMTPWFSLRKSGMFFPSSCRNKSNILILFSEQLDTTRIAWSLLSPWNMNSSLMDLPFKRTLPISDCSTITSTD